MERLSSIGLETAQNFLRLFEALHTTQARFLRQLPENRVVREDQRFRIWASNLGLYQRGHASLDYRLRDAGIVKQYTVDVLEELNEYLSNLIDVVSGKRPPYEDQILDPSEENGSQIDDSEDLNAPVNNGEVGTKHDEATGDPKYDTRTENPDRDETGTGDRSASDKELFEEVPSRFEAVIERIDSLYSLATKIRNPTTRPVRQNMDLYRHIPQQEREEYIAERELVEISVVKYIHKQQTWQLYQPKSDEEAGEDETLDRNSLDSGAQKSTEYVQTEAEWLLQRTGRANARRRAQLLYWQRHAKAIAGNALDEAVPQGPVQDRVATIKAADGTAKSETSELHSGPTIASRLDPRLVKLDDQKSVISRNTRVSSVAGPSGDRIAWPLPPTVPPSEKYLNCPYCKVICPARYLQRDAWKIHVIHDLQPYHCTYPDCNEADRIYGSRQEWTRHEGNYHERVWHCATHPTTEYETALDYIQHLETDHSEDTQDLQAPELVASCMGPSQILRRSCPFCLVNLTDVHEMHKHIAYHLEKFALLALPKDDDVENENGGSGSSKSNRPEAGRQESGARYSRSGDFDMSVPLLKASKIIDSESFPVDLTIENLQFVPESNLAIREIVEAWIGSQPTQPEDADRPQVTPSDAICEEAQQENDWRVRANRESSTAMSRPRSRPTHVPTRLLNTVELRFEEFRAGSAPNFAILSHRWGKDEVSYTDLLEGIPPSGRGFKKIKDFATLAKFQGYDWIWVDTCCIDKRSASELSEALNSMFSWYAAASQCYAYLADVAWDDDDIEASRTNFRNSNWFSRGWTLPELLAPAHVSFWDRDWKAIAPHTFTPIAQDISTVSGIERDYLGQRTSLEEASVATRMSWASRRITTRVEDMAYCLLGIFNVIMPPLYGEGWKAFHRLQLEIMKSSDDSSIFAWTDLEGFHTGVIAPYPSYFAASGHIVAVKPVPDKFQFNIVGGGNIQFLFDSDFVRGNNASVVLNCWAGGDGGRKLWIAIDLKREASMFQWQRSHPELLRQTSDSGRYRKTTVITVAA